MTEAVTGLDLVEAMIRIAGNQRLQLTQEDAGRINGGVVAAVAHAAFLLAAAAAAAAITTAATAEASAR